LKERINVINGDLFQADISEATVITLYLSASGNEHLKPKLAKEAPTGTRGSQPRLQDEWLARVQE